MYATPPTLRSSSSGGARDGAGHGQRIGEIAFGHAGLDAAVQEPDAVFRPVRPIDFGGHLARTRAVSRVGDLLSDVEAMRSIVGHCTCPVRGVRTGKLHR